MFSFLLFFAFFLVSFLILIQLDITDVGESPFLAFSATLLFHLSCMSIYFFLLLLLFAIICNYYLQLLFAIIICNYYLQLLFSHVFLFLGIILSNFMLVANNKNKPTQRNKIICPYIKI